jgi:hypothetical protein
MGDLPRRKALAPLTRKGRAIDAVRDDSPKAVVARLDGWGGRRAMVPGGACRLALPESEADRC